MNAQLAICSFESCSDNPIQFLYSEWSPGLLINYIVENHHATFKKTIPDLIALLEVVENTDGVACSELFELAVRFKSLASDVIIHMLKEEQLIFPIIKEVAKFVVMGKDKALFPFESIFNQIEVLEREHGNINEQMIYLRKLTNNFSPPVNTSQAFCLLYQELGYFEINLHQYIYLENNILFPKAINLEHNLG